MRVTENFDSVADHMACPCCNAFVYDKTTMKRIQILRDLVDKPFILDRSGGGFFRCSIYNTKIGGAKNSQHMLGKAMDIYSSDWDGATKWFFVSEAMKLGFSVGIYERFFHIDQRSGLPVIWYGK